MQYLKRANKQSAMLLISIALIFAMGILMVFDTTAAEVLDRDLDQSPHYAVVKQLVYALFAGLGAFIAWRFGYQNIIKMSGLLLVVASIMLILVFVPGIGQQINGAHRWIRLFGVSVQPSEFVKFLIPVYYIRVMTSDKKPIDFKSFVLLLVKLALPIALILVEPDNGTVAIIVMALIALFVLTKVRWVYWALPLLIFLGAAVLVALQMKHVPDRILVYLHPEMDLKGKGHQPHQSKIAAGSGGLFGKGIGESLQKLDYLPEARNDYIAAIYAEEFGFVGILGLIILYMMVGAIGFYLAAKAGDRPGFYLISIFTFLICFQAFLNLGVVSGLLPSKGTNLPFFSQGGSSLFVNFVALSLILNVGKTAPLEAHG